MGCLGATLREENSGRKHVDASSMLRMQHLQNLAKWASGEALISPLAALFGCRLSANAEALGIHLDKSLFPCERCETVLQPGYNCTIRIEKNTTKARPHKKVFIPTQNNMVYTCHFCSHQNLKWGTHKGHLKELLTLRPRPISYSKYHSLTEMKLDNVMADSSADVELHKNTPKRIHLKPEPIFDSQSSNPENGSTIKEPLIKNSLSIPLVVEKNRKSSKLGSDGRSSSENCSVLTDSGKAICESNKRRKSCPGLNDNSESTESQRALSIKSPVTPLEKMSVTLNTPVTPSEKMDITLNTSVTKMGVANSISGKKRKFSVSELERQSARGRSCSAITDPGTSISSKRRKSWSTLKEIAESSEHRRTFGICNLAIPFAI